MFFNDAQQQIQAKDFFLQKMANSVREATKKKQEKKFTTVVNYGGGSAYFGV